MEDAAHDLMNVHHAIASVVTLLDDPGLSPTERRTLHARLQDEQLRATTLITNLVNFAPRALDEHDQTATAADCLHDLLTFYSASFRTHRIAVRRLGLPDAPPLACARGPVEHALRAALRGLLMVTGTSVGEAIAASADQPIRTFSYGIHAVEPGWITIDLAVRGTRAAMPEQLPLPQASPGAAALACADAMLRPYGGTCSVGLTPAGPLVARCRIPVHIAGVQRSPVAPPMQVPAPVDASEHREPGTARNPFDRSGRLSRPTDTREELDRLRTLAGLRVLIIDDEPNFRWGLRQHLQRLRAEVYDVASGAEALALLHEDGTAFDVVLLDYRLPHETGDRIYEQIARAWPAIGARVILTSGSWLPSATKAAIDAAGVPFLRKPYTPDQLLELLPRLLPG